MSQKALTYVVLRSTFIFKFVNNDKLLVTAFSGGCSFTREIVKHMFPALQPATNIVLASVCTVGRLEQNTSSIAYKATPHHEMGTKQMSYSSKPDRTERRGRQIQRASVNNSSDGGSARTPAGRKAVLEQRDEAARSRGNIGIVRARVAESLAKFDLNDVRLNGLGS